MSIAKKLIKKITITENVIFVGGFAFIMYGLGSTYVLYICNSFKSHSFFKAIIDPAFNHQYFVSFISFIILLNATFVLWEICSFIGLQLKQYYKHPARGKQKFKAIFEQVSIHYKSSFLALLILELLPKVILLHMFWLWLPFFQKLQLFTINLSWYSWIYCYLCYELSSWLFHFSSHRVRLLWCLHSPHHAPTELNMSVNWIHFFAESYYSALVRLIILMLLGGNPAMFAIIIGIDSAWGVFIHISERSLKDGKLGFLQHIIITPAHHRVHHAKNPLYLDTNFANVIPIWDWVMGTLQPLRKEVKTEYGITRDLDVTNFSDLYFGELLLLIHDVRKTAGLKSKLAYIFMPPGWSPGSSAQTAAALRRRYLKENPGLGSTSKRKFLKLLNNQTNQPEDGQVAELVTPVLADVN